MPPAGCLYFGPSMRIGNVCAIPSQQIFDAVDRRQRYVKRIRVSLRWQRVVRHQRLRQCLDFRRSLHEWNICN